MRFESKGEDEFEPNWFDFTEEENMKDQVGPSSSSSCTNHPMEENGAHAVVPLASCPHLEQVAPVPSIGIDANATCSECHVGAEPWVCLTCYQVFCGRYVHEHGVIHSITSSHPMSLSLSDLSVWCHPCESYVHNSLLVPAKNSAYDSKFNH